MNEFFRTEMLIGIDNQNTLKNSKVAIFGIGGVGSYCAEALARCGIGKITLIDNDIVSVTNINRQIVALNSTVGKYKTQVMKERIEDINPSCAVEALNIFYNDTSQINLRDYDYVIDAIDTVTSKLLLAQNCNNLNIPLISSMGTGNKLNPSLLEITDIYKTSVCPLAKVMRRELKKRNIKSLKVVYSTEEPKTPLFSDQTSTKRQTPASISFVPSVAGLLIASEVVRELIKKID